MSSPLKVGIVAGEVSGDILGASLMEAIKSKSPQVSFHGVGGERMGAQGLNELAPMSEFAVNGFVDPILRLKPLYKLLRSLQSALTEMDVVVGVDFNVFNLLLERGLKKRGTPTAHYVSPSVYAWRRGRVKKIGRSTDVLMALFPFEIDVYQDRGVRAEFVGHPTADLFDPEKSKEEWIESSRENLGLRQEEFVLTLMPGSRSSELKFHFGLFLDTVRSFQQSASLSEIKVLIPTVHDHTKVMWEQLKANYPDLDVIFTKQPATEVLAASNLALVKSGTSTLEAMLVKTPMVVAYRVGAITARIVRAMMHTPYVALPNILANKRLVPELLQDDATTSAMSAALLEVHEQGAAELHGPFQSLHRSLKRNAAQRAADVVLSLLNEDANHRRRD